MTRRTSPPTFGWIATNVLTSLGEFGKAMPSALANRVIRGYDPTPRLAARWPVRVQIGDVAIAGGAIRMRPAGERTRR